MAVESLRAVFLDPRRLPPGQPHAPPRWYGCRGCRLADPHDCTAKPRPWVLHWNEPSDRAATRAGGSARPEVLRGVAIPGCHGLHVRPLCDRLSNRVASRTHDHGDRVLDVGWSS